MLSSDAYVFSCLKLSALPQTIFAMSPSNDRDFNFLYGSQAQGQKRSKRSFWPCKTPAEIHPRRSQIPEDTRSGEQCDTRGASSSTSTHRTKDRNSQTRSSRHQDSRRRKSPGRLPSQAAETDHLPEHHPPALSQTLVMHPFSRLASTVQQCPWKLGSDVDPSAGALLDDLFYPPVPRSLMHDTAVSFVVTDHTRPEQPRFVISCPLEHVDLIQRLLAPDGSRRVLSARGSSGHPRQGGQLRSMLLDGTPNIELAIHVGDGHASGSGFAGEGGGRGGGGSSQPGRPDGGGVGGPPAHTVPHSVSGGGGPPVETPDGSPPTFVPMTWVPAVPMPTPGWYGGPASEGPGIPYAPPPRVNP